jgi:hypothetical protein
VLPLRLARAAAEAEGLRLSLKARRFIFRAVLFYFALCLFFAAFGFLHVAVWCWLAETMSARTVALIVTGGDLVLGLILAGWAAFSGASVAEREALAVRRRALEEVWASLTLSALLFQVFNFFMRSRRRR